MKSPQRYPLQEIKGEQKSRLHSLRLSTQWHKAQQAAINLTNHKGLWIVFSAKAKALEEIH